MGKSKTVTNNIQSSTQQRDPYAAAIPGLQSAGAGVTAWMNNPAAKEAYSGPRVAQMSDRTSAGLDAMYDSTGLRQTQEYLSGLIGGGGLGGNNPYIGQLQDSIRASVMPSINSRVSAAGMAPGSSVDQALVGKEMTRAMAQPLFQTYENERARQMQAAGMMPGVSQGIIQNMIGSGQMGEQYDQRNIDAGRQAWEEQRTAGLRPYAEALPYLTQIGSAGGTSSGTTNSTQTSYQQPSMAQQIAGGAMMGASLFAPTGMFGAQGAFGSPMSWFGGGGGGGMVNGFPNNDPSGSYYR